MPSIPLEAQELIVEFKKQQAEEEIRRAKASEGRQTKKEVRQEGKKRWTQADLESYAKQLGHTIVTGGREGKYLRSPTGLRIPLPDHGSRKGFATGTMRHAKKMIEKFGIKRN